MLSDTRGYGHSNLRSRRSDTTVAYLLCRHLRNTGKCPMHLLEQSIRRKLMIAKEAELRAAAEELVALERESNPDTTVTNLQAVMAAMRSEPSYENWSIELEIDKEFFKLRKRRCLFSHMMLDRADLRVLEAEGEGEQQGGKQQKADGILTQAANIFTKFSNLSRLIALLILQNTDGLFLPKGLVIDVEAECVAEHERAVENGEKDEDAVLDVALVEKEKLKLVHVTFARLQVGLVDLSSIPMVLQHISRQTVGKFIGSQPTLSPFVKALLQTAVKSFTTVLAKEIDLSTATTTQQVLDALRVTLAVLWPLRNAWMQYQQPPDDTNNKETIQPGDDEDGSLKLPVLPSATLMNPQLRSLALRRCFISNSDALISSLKHYAATTLVALDLRDNKLDSLRFLFQLRASFGDRLLSLHLANNPITRKPDYKEQIRTTLPKIVTLDGESIRRPPLALPFPTTAVLPPNVSEAEYDAVLEAVRNFFSVWEARTVPTTIDSSADGHETRADIDEVNFAAVYLHPSCTVSMTLLPGCSWFNEAKMQLGTAVEDQPDFDGLRLSGQDLKELRVMDVSIRNANRNLTLGRAAVHRAARGPVNCFTLYRSTLYPERHTADHHMGSVSLSVQKLSDGVLPQAQRGGGGTAPSSSSTPTSVGSGPQKKRTRHMAAVYGPQQPVQQDELFFGVTNRKPTMYLVTLHSLMSWRSPTMQGEECNSVMVDRTMTFVKNPALDSDLARQGGRGGARRRAPGGGRKTSGAGGVKPAPLPTLLLFNDQISMRPLPNGAASSATSSANSGSSNNSTMMFPLFEPRSEHRIQRLAVEYGMDLDEESLMFVRRTLERCSSDAAVHRALASALQRDEPADTAAAGGTGGTGTQPPQPSGVVVEPVLLRRRSSMGATTELAAPTAHNNNNNKNNIEEEGDSKMLLRCTSLFSLAHSQVASTVTDGSPSAAPQQQVGSCGLLASRTLSRREWNDMIEQSNQLTV